ncbi:MAG: hypothetical protein L6R38_009086 [Xanthoria sp. 2 TBL-2021]|nr:MAG: hypothetical protein L6R38_009086 [Xanthoria sp. 2 TBL-2021]
MCLSEFLSDKDLLETQFDTLYLWTDIMNKTNRITQSPDRQRELLVIAFKISGQRTFWEFLQARAYNQIGVALCLSNKFAKGIEEFMNSIGKYHQPPKLLGGIDTEPKVNMALAYWCQGYLAKAEEVLRGTFEAWDAGFGTMEGYLRGRILHALGNVRYDVGRFEETKVLRVGRFEESKELHERALQQYKTTFGKAHHKTADLCHKVARHCILRAEYGRARKLIDQGLGIWQREERFHQPELARTTFLKAILAERCGNEEEAAGLMETAREMRNKVPHATVKTDKEPLTEWDFDEIVAFFAR